MTEKKLYPPQPFSYPDHWLMKRLFKTPVLLYRFGLGKLIGKYVFILSSTGRKSGKTRLTPVEYFEHEGRIYIVSGFGSQPDWYQNIASNPQVTIQTHQGTMNAAARKPITKEEWMAVYDYLTHSPITKLFMADYTADLRQSTILEQVKNWPALTFDPSDKPCPPALEADLVWAWPLILLGGALHILIGWLIQRKQ